jgi:hypothetical protein
MSMLSQAEWKAKVRNKWTLKVDISVRNRKGTCKTNELVIRGLSTTNKKVKCEIHELITVRESNKEKSLKLKAANIPQI